MNCVYVAVATVHVHLHPEKQHKLPNWGTRTGWDTRDLHGTSAGPMRRDACVRWVPISHGVGRRHNPTVYRFGIHMHFKLRVDGSRQAGADARLNFQNSSCCVRFGVAWLSKQLCL